MRKLTDTEKMDQFVGQLIQDIDSLDEWIVRQVEENYRRYCDKGYGYCDEGYGSHKKLVVWDSCGA